MSGAIFGKSYPFRGADQEIPASKEDSSSYGEALKLILDRCIPLVVLGRKNLNNPWLPKKLRELYHAALVFQEHMTEAYESEKKAMMRNGKLENNLMTSLVRASLANVDQTGSATGAHHEGLTEEEVYGNVFVFNFAGHDATANSLAIGICLLATRPDVQDWIAEEINAVLAGVNSAKSSYEDTFRRLPRCLAVVVSKSSAVSVESHLTPSLVRDRTSLHRRRNSQVHRLQPTAIEARYRHRHYPEEHSRHTELFRLAHTSALLGPRLPRLRAFAMDHLGSTRSHVQWPAGLISTSHGALERAAHTQ